MKNKKGFTLLELMMVIGIIGIMSGVLLVSLSSLKRNASLKTAQAETASALRLAQNYALQGKVVTGEIICGYGLRFSNSQEYQIFYTRLTNIAPNTSCDSQNSDNSLRQHNETFSSLIETHSLPRGVSLSSSLTDAEIFFTIPHANAYDNSGFDFSEDTWEFDFSGSKKTITINERGLITEN